MIQECTDLMAKDGVIDNTEIKIIDKLTYHLGLDQKKVNALKDIHIIKGVKHSSSTPESILGINPSWDSLQIQKHLNTEFIKWNNRLSNVSEKKKETIFNICLT